MENLAYRRFGRLQVQNENLRRKSDLFWVCLCDCGNVKEIRHHHLLTGSIQSCGCLRKERAFEATKSRYPRMPSERSIHNMMKARCNNIQNKDYRYYGEKGITYDPKWESFCDFWDDMKEGYFKGLSLERLDVTKGYFKDNCKWIPHNLQAQNTSVSRWVVYNKQKMCAAIACRLINTPNQMVYERARRKKISFQEAFDYFANKVK